MLSTTSDKPQVGRIDEKSASGSFSWCIVTKSKDDWQKVKVWVTLFLQITLHIFFYKRKPKHLHLSTIKNQCGRPPFLKTNNPTASV